jgi:hypothetical protein
VKQLLEQIERALARADALGEPDAGIYLDRARVAVVEKMERSAAGFAAQKNRPTLQ